MAVETQERPATTLQREPVRARIVFAGTGTKQPGFVFENVDPLQVLCGLEAIEAGTLKVDRQDSLVPGRPMLEIVAPGADDPINVCISAGLTPTQRRASVILLRLWAEQMANRFIAASMAAQAQPQSALLVPRH